LLTGGLSPASAATPKCGTLKQNETWTAAESPYQLTCNVTVARGTTLTIGSGVTVDTHYNDITVSGTLSASNATLCLQSYDLDPGFLTVKAGDVSRSRRYGVSRGQRHIA
jgi:hypothetical protein